jgi:hypothetical protein
MSSYNKNTGDKARLISPVFNKSSDNQLCSLRLFYYMYGIDIGALNIYVRTSIGGNEALLFNRNKEQGNYWERLERQINETNPFQIVIEGIVGNGDLGDLAIDDVTFTPGCVKDTSELLPTGSTNIPVTTQNTCNGFKCKSDDKCISSNLVCNFINDCLDKSDEAECGTCDFEKSWCGYYDDSDGEENWNRRKAPSMNPNGPKIDHTYGNSSGHFLITEKNNGNFFTDQVALYGPPTQETAESCRLIFWIHMATNLQSYVYFYYINASNSNQFKYIGDISGPLGDRWVKSEIAIGKQPANYQLEVFAYPDLDNSDFYSDIAFDGNLLYFFSKILFFIKTVFTKII